MTTRPPESGKEASRLDPQAVPRRDVLGMAACGVACGTCAFAFIGSMRLPNAAVLPSASKKFKVVLPETLLPGEPYIPTGRTVAIFRDPDGLYAVSTVCTHLGCIVKPIPSGFDCPCHGSKFGPDGSLQVGPAPTGLSWLKVQPAGGGAVIIDEGRVVPPNTKEKE